MERASAKAREEFIATLSHHTPDSIGYFELRDIAKRIMRYGATYARIQEHGCNSPDYKYGQDEYNKMLDRRWERETARLEKKEARIEAKLTELCATFGGKPIFQGDPRGNTIKIAVPDGYTNDWGKEGICVPTS